MLELLGGRGGLKNTQTDFRGKRIPEYVQNSAVSFVIPAQAGIQGGGIELDPHQRGDDITMVFL